MNMIARIEGGQTKGGIFGRLQTLIAAQPRSLDAARSEARQLVAEAMADTCQFDTLWSAVDAFHAHFEFLMQTVELNGSSDASMKAIRAKCRFYLEQVEALCLAARYR
jgi:hypothetical protein